MARLIPKYPTKNLAGKRFNSWVVLSYEGTTKNKSNTKSYSLWRCRCDCGKEQIKRRDVLLKSKMCKDCANKLKGEKYSLPFGEAAFNSLYSNNYKRRAKKHNIYFDLTKDQFRNLVKQNCFYCGALPSQMAHYLNQNGEYIYNGIDRVDNDEGYTIDNCVACCKKCNYMKKASDFQEFVSHIKTIYSTLKQRGYYGK